MAKSCASVRTPANGEAMVSWALVAAWIGSRRPGPAMRRALMGLLQRIENGAWECVTCGLVLATGAGPVSSASARILCVVRPAAHTTLTLPLSLDLFRSSP